MYELRLVEGELARQLDSGEMLQLSYEPSFDFTYLSDNDISEIAREPGIDESRIKEYAGYESIETMRVHPDHDQKKTLEKVQRTFAPNFSGQLPHPERLRRSEGGVCTPARRVGLTRSKSACSAGPDASGNLIVGVLHSTPCRTRATERHVASRSLRRTRLRGQLTATRPCRETHRGLVGTPALADCLWPVMDSPRVVALGCKRSHALFPTLLARFGRSSRTGIPRYRLVESD